ncbi:MAG: DUF2330 domain-containing protein [Chitinophagales bacterium]
MKRIMLIIVAAIGIMLPQEGKSFCGFYVAKADAKLFNKASQVILARDGEQTTVTMSNDFQGDVQDFAMVVPVPSILQEKDIKVVDRYIFDKLDAYSGPRLVEYYDQNPCWDNRYMYDESMMVMPTSMTMDMEVVEEEEMDLGVTIEAEYTVGEYDILILSAEESEGLKTWLTQNDYQISEDAEEVLDPYIKSDMKFFVVKVNLEEKLALGEENLRPLQITYESDKFMLPIRLGMANAEDTQDMIVYAFTKDGRVETTNYRTVEIPSNKEIPTFVKDQFGQFYKDLFEKAYKRNGRNSVFLEYSWDLSSSNYTKCDPCATTPPTYAELSDAGVFWAEQNYNGGWGSSDYTADLFITRLHVKYDRDHFPQDLQFQATPNKTNYQGRYIMNHPVTGVLECEEAVTYYETVLDRRENELDELAYLTGWDIDEYEYYVNTYENKYDRAKKKYKKGGFIPIINLPNSGGGMTIALLSMSLMVLFSIVFYWRKRWSLA